MNVNVNTATAPSSVPSSHENLEASSESQKLEQHKRKSEKVNADELFKVGEHKGKAGAQLSVTNYLLPAVTSEKDPDISKAMKYISSEQYNKACKLAPCKLDETFRFNIFGTRGFEFFVLVSNINKMTKAQLHHLSAVMSYIKKEYNDAMQRNIRNKGEEQMAMAMASSVVGAMVTTVGTGGVVKSTVQARKDMKLSHEITPGQQTHLANLENELAAMDPTDLHAGKARGEINNKITSMKGEIETTKMAGRMASSRVEMNTAIAMAIGGLSGAATGAIDGAAAAVAAVNEVAVQAATTSLEVMTEIRNKNEDLANEQKIAMNAALEGMSTMSNWEKDLISTVAANVK